MQFGWRHISAASFSACSAARPSSAQPGISFTTYSVVSIRHLLTTEFPFLAICFCRSNDLYVYFTGPIDDRSSVLLVFEVPSIFPSLFLDSIIFHSNKQ